MSSRQEQKAARRAEREAQEAAAAKAAARSRRLQVVMGTVLVLAILGGSTYALVNRDSGSSGSGSASAPDAKVPIPAVKETDRIKAAAAAKCVQVDPPNKGGSHVEGQVEYESNPATSGDHSQVPAQDGIYAVGAEPGDENWVHSLEHGRITIQYGPNTPKRTIDELETVASEKLNDTEAYKTLTFQNPALPYAVSVVAWDHFLGCKTMSPQVFDAIRAFRADYVDKAPELVP